MRLLRLGLILVLPLADLALNLTHLSIGLVDFYGLAAAARGMAEDAAWPATPYFPAGYPLLLIPFGLAGSVLVGGYILSAAGLMLGLRAVAGMCDEFGLPAWSGAVAILLAWMTPSYRLVASSPSVDALYTGMALVFLWSGLAIWRRKPPPPVTLEQARAQHPAPPGAPWIVTAGQLLMPWGAAIGLILPAVMLPLLRYHALVLVVPVLLLLWATRPAARYALTSAAFGLAVAVTFNWLLWSTSYGAVMPGVVGAQMRIGIEIDRPTLYGSVDEIFNNYVTFVRRSRTTSVIQDYGAARVVGHTLRNWGLFLRRPTVALALLLTFVLMALQRHQPAGIALIALWGLGYTLALSPAYYTLRASLLPELALLPTLLAGAAAMPVVRRLASPLVATAVVAVLLMLAYWPAGRYARMLTAQVRHNAGVSRQFAEYLKSNRVAAGRVVVADMRVTWLPGDPEPNRWSRPYRTLRGSWMMDPAIDGRQRRGARPRSLEGLAQRAGGAELVLVSSASQYAQELETLTASPIWLEAGRIGEHIVFRLSHVASTSWDAGEE